MKLRQRITTYSEAGQNMGTGHHYDGNVPDLPRGTAELFLGRRGRVVRQSDLSCAEPPLFDDN